MRELVVIGVPSSAGAHHAGQELAPQALRAAGLIDELRQRGLVVHDEGDVAGSVFQVVDVDIPVRNLAEIVRVAGGVAEAVAGAAQRGLIPIVVGGDCTITVGVVAGLQRVFPDLSVAYFDGDADLKAPERTTSGILDATGVAHLLGLADNELARLGERYPLLAPADIVLLGYDPNDPDSVDEATLAARPDLLHFSYYDLREDADRVVARALAQLERDDSRLVVHFDVDAVDSRDLPLANFPHYGTGVPLATATEILSRLLSNRNLGALVLTEVNPTHDPDGSQLRRYVTAIAEALGSLSADSAQ